MRYVLAFSALALLVSVACAPPPSAPVNYLLVLDDSLYDSENPKLIVDCVVAEDSATLRMVLRSDRAHAGQWNAHMGSVGRGPGGEWVLLKDDPKFTGENYRELLPEAKARELLAMMVNPDRPEYLTVRVDRVLEDKSYRFSLAGLEQYRMRLQQLPRGCWE
ncbi:MAG: hypothetical protein F4X64_10085 [Chloroflexi bacterium]|nr:hypothetical protein [Chloroflexota bacterium]